MEISFTATLWEYDGQGAWHFVTLRRETSREIRALTEGRRKVGGTVRVAVHLGRSRWPTSLFWDQKRQAFLLPVKASVRQKEQLTAGMTIEVDLQIPGAA
jgi:hypothetical protein